MRIVREQLADKDLTAAITFITNVTDGIGVDWNWVRWDE